MHLADVRLDRLATALASLPQRPYISSPSPLHAMGRLSKQLDGPTLLIKRDDTLRLAMGGNKVRKLAFIVADALARGADTLITMGAVQSNHCLLTLAAANAEGLACRLVLEERVPDSYDPTAGGNGFLFRLLGAERIDVVRAGAVATGMRQAEEAAHKDGRIPYLIPGGGSNALGSCGYAACALELLDDLDRMHVQADRIICASGSGGTHAGLLAGLIAAGSNIPVTGINVRSSTAAQTPRIKTLAEETLAFLRIDAEVEPPRVVCRDGGSTGYSLRSDEMVDAVTTVARTEGILLDPVYTGKAMAGLFGMISSGEIDATEKVVFVHTGGTSALFAYQTYFSENDV